MFADSDPYSEITISVQKNVFINITFDRAVFQEHRGQLSVAFCETDPITANHRLRLNHK